jgi:lysyl-tRNA synthetase class 2
MASIEEIRNVRLQKIEILKKYGKNPFPSKSHKTHTIKECLDNFDYLESQKKRVTLAGRVMSLRPQGALIFINIFDGTESFQGLLKKDEPITEELFSLFFNTIDIGDFVEIEGGLFVTNRGQKTVLVEGWNILTKSLAPLPEKWAGITDPDERYRKRYLDILMDSELRDIFYKKAKFWESARNFMKDNGFLEVETPTIEVTTGGAEANPFKTHHKDFDIDVFMRISVGELWQKRLMASGFPKTFEIGRVYRNEGTSPDHLQEFTNMEFYIAYEDYEFGMEFVENLYKYIAINTFGKTEFSTRGHTFNLNDKWKKISYVEEIKKQTGIDVLEATEDEMKEKLNELNVKYTGTNKERLTDTLWKYCRKNISGPAFLIRIPKLVSPLSKACEDDNRLTERFQPILAGSEVGNGFSELNDPIDQRERFNLQQELIERGDDEAMMPEWEFVEMLEHGMPPTFGFGFGERLFAFLVDKPLRETQLFPLMKPKKED